jgi:hypothetical protein
MLYKILLPAYIDRWVNGEYYGFYMNFVLLAAGIGFFIMCMNIEHSEQDEEASICAQNWLKMS